jgi:hypothetical protein
LATVILRIVRARNWFCAGQRIHEFKINNQWNFCTRISFRFNTENFAGKYGTMIGERGSSRSVGLFAPGASLSPARICQRDAPHWRLRHEKRAVGQSGCRLNSGEAQSECPGPGNEVGI